MYFIQMSGFPGSGKSTLAQAIAPHIPALIIDHDIAKSSLLHSLSELSIPSPLMGKASYDLDFALADFHLSLGHSVILDSPCLYEEVFQKGQQIAWKHQADYRYVECYLDDVDEINRRLQQRDAYPSQIQFASSEEAIRQTIQATQRPCSTEMLRIDARQPVSSYIENVLQYIHASPERMT